jgi:hypothetical protein
MASSSCLLVFVYHVQRRSDTVGCCGRSGEDQTGVECQMPVVAGLAVAELAVVVLVFVEELGRFGFGNVHIGVVRVDFVLVLEVVQLSMSV